MLLKEKNTTYYCIYNTERGNLQRNCVTDHIQCLRKHYFRSFVCAC